MAKRALCIGINNYPGTDSDLAGCVNDAHDWAKVLQDRGFTAKTMLNKQATAKQMRKAIEALVLDAKKGDSLVIQYSGHGSFVPDLDGDEPDGTDECLCPYDVMRNGPITDDELFEISAHLARGVKALMISDSCHSGSVTRFAPITTPPTAMGKNAPQRTVRFLPPTVYLPRREVSKLGLRRAIRRSSPPGRYGALLMAGCQDVEYSYDAYFRGRPNGAFTFAAIRALSKLRPNATYSAWFKEIRKTLPSRQYPQSPNLYGASSMKKWKVLA
jgi:metacaspase-1